MEFTEDNLVQFRKPNLPLCLVSAFVQMQNHFRNLVFDDLDIRPPFQAKLREMEAKY